MEDVESMIALRDSLSKKIVDAQRARRSEGVAKVQAVMAGYGLELRDLTTRPLYMSQLAPKYADASGNTWTGVGRRPLWVKRLLAAGLSLADYRVRK